MVSRTVTGMAPPLARNWFGYALAATSSAAANLALASVVVENVQSGRVPLSSPQVFITACWGVGTLYLSIQAFRGWFQASWTM